MNKGIISKTTKLMALLLFLISSSVQAMPTVNFVDQSDTANSNIPVTFGQVFAVGDVPAGMSVNLVAGATSLATQVDMKATHPDGSLRHAVISIMLPALSAGQNLTTELAVVDPSTTGSAINLTDLLATNFTGEVNLNVAGTEYTANIRDLLEDIGTGTDVIFKNSFDNNTRSQIWLSGSEVTEWIVTAPFETAAGVEHPHLTARFNVRAYAGFDSVRVDVIVENNWSYVPEPQNFDYDVSVSLCGNNVYNKADLTHYHHARWRKTFWCGNEPAVHIKHDIDYLIDSYAVPNYDRSLVIPETDLLDMDTNWSGDKIEPMGIGSARANMRAGGARPDIGPLPRWVVRYLLSQDVRAKTTMLGTADLAGSWPIHYRYQTKNQPISIDDYPYVSILGRFNSTLNPNTGNYEALPDCGGDCATPYTPDSAHQPSFSYVPYLVTGDHYHLEELLFWSNYNIMRAHPASRKQQDGLVKWEQVRGQAWSLRTLSHAAYISPDFHPMKQYFIEKVGNNINYYDTQYTNNSSAPALGFVTNGFAIKQESGQGKISPWNDDALTAVVQNLVDMDFSNAIPFRDWKVKFIYGRFSNDPVFCQTDAAAYRYVVQDIYQGDGFPVVSTWSELLNLSFPSDVNNCPAEYNNGLPGHPESYLAITRGALAAAVAAGYNNANTYMDIVIEVMNTANADFNSNPHWAIVPRN